MGICPPHCYLDDVVQIGDCAVALGFDSTPNHGTDAQDKNMKLVDNKLLRIAHWVILPYGQSHLPPKKSFSPMVLIPYFQVVVYLKSNIGMM